MRPGGTVQSLRKLAQNGKKRQLGYLATGTSPFYGNELTALLQVPRVCPKAQGLSAKNRLLSVISEKLLGYCSILPKSSAREKQRKCLQFKPLETFLPRRQDIA